MCCWAPWVTCCGALGDSLVLSGARASDSTSAPPERLDLGDVQAGVERNRAVQDT